MTQQTGQPDINVTIQAWADIVVNILRENIVKMGIHRGSLFDSIRHAGSDPQKIEFIFLLYGIYVDAGVGKGMKGGFQGWSEPDLFGELKMGGRQRKQWFSKSFYWQVIKLKDILSEKYGLMYIQTIKESVRGVKVDFE
jgi:hypothetical protein